MLQIQNKNLYLQHWIWRGDIEKLEKLKVTIVKGLNECRCVLVVENGFHGCTVQQLNPFWVAAPAMASLI